MLALFDVFPKFSEKNYHLKTVSGGIITLCTAILVTILYYQRFYLILHPQYSSDVVLDDEHVDGQRKVYVYFDLEIEAPCPKLHLDLFEINGQEHLDIINTNITRTRITENGMTIQEALEYNLKHAKKTDYVPPKDYCGPCHGAAPKNKSKIVCCNTCQDVVDKVKHKISKNKEGWSFYNADGWEQCEREGVTNFGIEKCHYKGHLKIKKQSGNFHFGLGQNLHDSSRAHSHNLMAVPNTASINHSIKYLHFGPQTPDFQPPIKDIKVRVPDFDGKRWLATYFLNVVPSRFIKNNNRVDTYRYSVMYNQREVPVSAKKGNPGIVFQYDFAPLAIVSQPSVNVHSLLVDICGLIGGAFSFAAIIDALMFSALSTIEGKRNIGKDV